MMGKKKTVIEEVPVVPEGPKLFTIADKALFIRLWKTPALTSAQWMEIYQLHKKYLNPNKPFPKSSCGGCSNSLVNMYNETRDWFAKHRDEFIN